jgi:hypothetical protein
MNNVTNILDYAGMVNTIIDSNQQFYRSSKKIRWAFKNDSDISNFACYRKKEDIILINYLAAENAIANNHPLDIEYFILHEIRHVFQQEEIEDYKNKQPIVVNEKIIKKWITEDSNYHSATPNDEEGLEEYFNQDEEIDAYAYSYAIMEYKYGKERTSYLYMPEYNKKEFIRIKNEWIKAFKNENLEKSKALS